MPLQRLLTNTVDQLDQISREHIAQKKRAEVFKKFFKETHVYSFFEDMRKHHSDETLNSFASYHTEERVKQLIEVNPTMYGMWYTWMWDTYMWNELAKR